ncbi:MAG: hypothetical protein GY757_16650, partial [bacterium]|nr:hypothetical protein [bacterium]
ELWAGVLGIEIEKIGLDSNFFQLGGHSLKATVLVSKIHKHLNVKISLAEIFKQPTIRYLGQYIKTKDEDKWEVIEPVEKKEHYPLSAAQNRLFTLNIMEDANVVYNLPGVWQLKGKFSLPKFEKALQTMIERHESLRTSFHIRAGVPAQVIEKKNPFKLEYNVAATGSKRDGDIQRRITRFFRPFDLKKAPLLRVGIIRLEEEKHLLLLDMHHIIADGVTMVI